jgi:hypothetical protein
MNQFKSFKSKYLECKFGLGLKFIFLTENYLHTVLKYQVCNLRIHNICYEFTSVKSAQGRAKDNDAGTDNAQSVINHAAPRARTAKFPYLFAMPVHIK